MGGCGKEKDEKNERERVCVESPRQHERREMNEKERGTIKRNSR